MPYVREKKVPGKDGKVYSYYQLVEGRRVDGKVRQRVVAHLGKHDSMEDARAAAASVVPKVEEEVARPSLITDILSGRVSVPKVEEEVAPNNVVPNFFHLSPDILSADDQQLRKERNRIRATARYRRRKLSDIEVAADIQGCPLEEEDWETILTIERYIGELTHDADRLTDELARRKLASKV